MTEPSSEACFLDALAMHIQSFRDTDPGLNPAVLIKVNGQWCPVRAGIKATGEHRNAVAIEYLPAAPSDVLRATYTVQEGSENWRHAASGFDSIEEANQWIDEHPSRLIRRIVESAERVVG